MSHAFSTLINGVLASSIQSVRKDASALYFRLSLKKFNYVKSPVGVNSLNAVLPDMGKKAGIKVKTLHCLVQFFV